MLTATLEDVFRRIVREELAAALAKLAAVGPKHGPEEYLTLVQASALSSLSVPKLRRLQGEGKLGRFGDDHSVRVSRAELLAYMARGGDSTPADLDAKADEILGKRAARRG